MLKSRSGDGDSRLLPSDSPEAAERQVVELAQRAGKLDLDGEAVLAADSPWRRFVRHLASMREATTARERGRAAGRLEQIVAAAPAFDEEIVLRGERAAAEAQDADALAVRHDAAADEADAEIRGLPRARRTHRLIGLEWLLSALAFVATDTVILHLSLLASPGASYEHWFTAAGVATGLLVYAHCAGWLWTATLGEWPSAWRTRALTVLMLGAVMALPAVAFVLLQDFRSGSLMQQAAAGGIPIADPSFFLPMQAVLFCGALLVSTRLFLAKDEQRLRGRRDGHRAKASAARTRADEARSRHAAALRERAEAQQLVDKARSELTALRANAAAEDAVTREHGAHLAGLLDAEYLIAQAARRRQDEREERERVEAERAKQEALAAAERARDEAEAHARAEHERRLALREREAELDLERDERRARSGVRSLVEIGMRSLLAATTAALVAVAMESLTAMVLGAGLIAGLAVASGLLLRRSVLLARRLNDDTRPPVVFPPPMLHVNGHDRQQDMEVHS